MSAQVVIPYAELEAVAEADAAETAATTEAELAAAWTATRVGRSAASYSVGAGERTGTWPGAAPADTDDASMFGAGSSIARVDRRVSTSVGGVPPSLRGEDALADGSGGGSTEGDAADRGSTGQQEGASADWGNVERTSDTQVTGQSSKTGQ